MHTLPRFSAAAALTALAMTVQPGWAATDADTLQPDERVQLAGHDLKLNGTGVGARMMFKIYAISLYLLEPRRTTEDVLNADGPRRISILMLRDVSGENFSHALAESATESNDGQSGAAIGAEVSKVAMTIAERSHGFHKGDRLMLDWIPGVGATIDLNRHALLEPIADRKLYNALLEVWLGAKPVDRRLKAQLLGAAAS